VRDSLDPDRWHNGTNRQGHTSSTWALYISMIDCFMTGCSVFTAHRRKPTEDDDNRVIRQRNEKVETARGEEPSSCQNPRRGGGVQGGDKAARNLTSTITKPSPLKGCLLVQNAFIFSRPHFHSYGSPCKSEGANRMIIAPHRVRVLRIRARGMQETCLSLHF
jgi:hypothetical protein